LERAGSLDVLKRRAVELLEQARSIRKDQHGWRDEVAVQRVFQGALNVAVAAYGPASAQVGPLMEWVAPEKGSGIRVGSVFHYNVAVAALETLLVDIDTGLVGNLRLRIGGDVLADFVGLAREALRDGGPEGVKVAAVLAAAAFEDAIRRIGEELADVTGRPKLEEVVQRLRGADVLRGGYARQALDLLPFRNDALHADWPKITRALVESALAFVDALVRDRLT
jgi:hypothetical protein